MEKDENLEIYKKISKSFINPSILKIFGIFKVETCTVGEVSLYWTTGQCETLGITGLY